MTRVTSTDNVRKSPSYTVVKIVAVAVILLIGIPGNATSAERIERLVEATNGYIDRAVSQKQFTYAQHVASLAYNATQATAGEHVRRKALDRLREVQQLHADYAKREGSNNQ